MDFTVSVTLPSHLAEAAAVVTTRHLEQLAPSITAAGLKTDPGTGHTVIELTVHAHDAAAAMVAAHRFARGALGAAADESGFARASVKVSAAG
jgi:hypothetical protein